MPYSGIAAQNLGRQQILSGILCLGMTYTVHKDLYWETFVGTKALQVLQQCDMSLTLDDLDLLLGCMIVIEDF